MDCFSDNDPFSLEFAIVYFTTLLAQSSSWQPTNLTYNILCTYRLMCAVCQSSMQWYPVRCSSWKMVAAATRTSPWPETIDSAVPGRPPKTLFSLRLQCCTIITFLHVYRRTIYSGYGDVIWWTKPAWGVSVKYIQSMYITKVKNMLVTWCMVTCTIYRLV